MTMETAPASVQAGHIIQRLSILGDDVRARMLGILNRNEFTVSELGTVLQMPQPSVSRHLKALSEDGWLTSRVDGRSRHYRMKSPLDSQAAALWEILRTEVHRFDAWPGDLDRAKNILSRRQERSREFFSKAADRWEELREELFGDATDLFPLYGLLDHEWTVGDLGCGTGLLAASIAPYVGQVVGVDRSPEMLAAARTRLQGREHVEFRQGTLESLPIDDESLDVGIGLLVLHYVPEPDRAIREMARTLRPGGRVVLIDMKPHGRDDLRAEMGHLWAGFSEEEMRSWLLEAGLERPRYTSLPLAPKARGPLLFVASAVKAYG